MKGEHRANLMNFYRFIQDVFEVECLLGRKKVLFKCELWNVEDNIELQLDKKWNIASVNVSQKWYQD